MFDVGTDFDKLLWVEGRALDAVDEFASFLEREMFADTSVLLLEGWERVFGITPVAGATIPARQAAIVAALRATGGLNRSYFEEIARVLGYEIGASGQKHLQIIEDAFAPFRADYGRADIDAVYDQGAGASMYTWRVLGTGVESDTELQRLFEALKTAGTEVIFEDE